MLLSLNHLLRLLFLLVSVLTMQMYLVAQLRMWEGNVILLKK